MRKTILLAMTSLILGVCVLLQAGPSGKVDQTATVRLRLVDAGTGEAIGGLVRVFPAGQDRPIALDGLFDRLRGLKLNVPLGGWHVVPSAGASTFLPRGKIRIEAISGLESTLLRQEFDLTADPPKEIVLRLKPAFEPEKAGLVAGNTHLHLMNLTAEDAEEYLKQIPAADRLKVLFLSYLERAKDDATYITNRYPIGDLKQFDATGVLVNNGEEHRHNFGSHGSGYGHVMFLNIQRLIKPISLGPGITGTGDDATPLRPGLDEARKQRGTIIWCHNTFGFERTPSALTDRIDALNVFDGARLGTYEDAWYRFLNIGMRLPISTGTDWFIYDFARVYAHVPGKLTIPGWLDAVRAGRCQATNGPLLSLTVDGREIGSVLNLKEPRAVRIVASASGRHDFQKLQLVRSGKVIQSETAEMKDGVYSARLVRDVRIDEPAWFAVRIDSTAKNELDRPLFAHTSPVYVDFEGKRILDVEAGRALQKELEAAKEEIRSRGKFGDDPARDRILAIYDDSVKELTRRLNQRGK